MYSTLKGAKKCAKQLKKILEASNYIYPLFKCQEAVARAGRYKNWRDLTNSFAAKPKISRSFDYWGNLIKILPVPCYDVIKFHLLGDAEYEALNDDAVGYWLRDVLPYSMALEVEHRSKTGILRPGAGKNQRNRLTIMSCILMNVEGPRGLAPKLDPETLTVELDALPETLLPQTAKGPQFQNALNDLIEARLIEVVCGKTRVLAPSGAFRDGVIERAERSKNSRRPVPQHTNADGQLAATFGLVPLNGRDKVKRQVPYSDLNYEGVKLESRYRLDNEFREMKKVVDQMSMDVQESVTSIFCDSKADSVYVVEVRQGKFTARLANAIHECFIAGTFGFNSVFIEHGCNNETAAYFGPYWPNDEIGEEEAAALQI